MGTLISFSAINLQLGDIFSTENNQVKLTIFMAGSCCWPSNTSRKVDTKTIILDQAAKILRFIFSIQTKQHEKAIRLRQLTQSNRC